MYWLLSFLGIILFAFAPILPLLALELLGLADGLNASNSVIAGSLPWMLIITLPVGVVSLVIWVVMGFVKLIGCWPL